jgi:iron complex transport system substrate-binding protein
MDMRIVSLLPAATDCVVALGRLPDLVGRTHECDWPPGELDDIPVLTGTDIDAERMSSHEMSDAVGTVPGECVHGWSGSSSR